MSDLWEKFMTNAENTYQECIEVYNELLIRLKNNNRSLCNESKRAVENKLEYYKLCKDSDMQKRYATQIRAILIVLDKCCHKKDVIEVLPQHEDEEYILD